MGEQVKRPYREGEGVKPTTPKPTFGLMQTKNFSDGTATYRVSCSCDSPDCDLRIWVEGSDLDCFDGEVAVRIYATTRTPIWKEGFNRISAAMKLLFLGQAEYETETLLTKDQALLFADALKNKVKEMDAQRKKLAKAKSQPVATKGKPK